MRFELWPIPCREVMSVARTTCLMCCLDVAQGQAVQPGLTVCQRCTQPLTTRPIVVLNSGISSLRLAMFNRLRSPRVLSLASNFVGNVCMEQLRTWMRPSWRHISSCEHSAKQDVHRWCLTEWSDIKWLCSFQEVAAGTRFPTQGLGNVRASDSATMGIICPPVVVMHRC